MSERETMNPAGWGLALVAGLLLLGTEASAQRVDRYGDSLPDQAIARLGTARFRGVHGCLAYSPDGKLLATATGAREEVVTLWDAATGRVVRQLTASPGLMALMFAPKGKHLACMNGSGNCQLFALDSGKELFAVPATDAVFVEEGRKLLLVRDENGPEILRCDTATGMTVRLWGVNAQLGERALSRDGRLLAFLDEAQPRVVLVHDAVTGALIHSIPRPRAPGELHLALSGDGKRLALLEDQGVRLCDTSTGEEIARCAQGGGDPPVFSPDGRRLAWIGADNEASRLWVLDGDGSPHRAVGGPLDYSGTPCFSPDGSVLAAVTVTRVVQQYRTDTGKPVTRFDAHVDGLVGVAFTPEGRHVVTLGHDEVFTWSTPTGAVLHRAPATVSKGESCLRLLPDGRRLLFDAKGSSFRLRDAEAGREVLRFTGKNRFLYSHSVVTAPGGRFLAVLDAKHEIHVFDLRSGKDQYHVTAPDANGLYALSDDGDMLVWYHIGEDQFDFEVRRHTSGKSLRVSDLPLSNSHRLFPGREVARVADCPQMVLPDGKGSLRRWDLNTFQELPSLTGAQYTIHDVSWSPDGRLVGTRGDMAAPGARGGRGRQDVRWWDAVSGERATHLDTPGAFYFLRFSPDSRMLAVTRRDGMILLRETATGHERAILRGHLPQTALTVAFSADGRFLASGGEDSQAFLWDLTSRMPDGLWHDKPLDAAARRAAWDRLASRDATAAYTAQWQLIADPEGTLTLLRDQLRPLPRPDPRQVRTWIAALGSDDFTERDRASRALGNLGDLVADELAAALKQDHSAEARRRLEALREALQGPPTGCLLQRIRGVEVLERLDTAEARELLRKLAEGENGRVGREARAALAYLANAKR